MPKGGGFSNDNHGGNALKEGRKLESKQDELLTRTDPGITVPGQNRPEVDHKGIGGRYFDVTPDESARVFEKKDQILSEKSMQYSGKGWQAQVTDRDAQRLIEQEQRLADAQYEDWLAKNFVQGMKNPSDAAWAQRTFPSYFQKRKKVIEDYTEIQKKMAMMQLTGPQSEEDLKLIYMHNACLIKIPTEAVHNMQPNAGMMNEFIRGRFNPRRLAGNNNGVSMANGTPLSVAPNPLAAGVTPWKNLASDNVAWAAKKPENIAGL